MMLHGQGLMAFLACVCMSIQRKLISSTDLDNVINLHTVMVCKSVLGSSVLIFFKKPTYVRDSQSRRLNLKLKTVY